MEQRRKRPQVDQKVLQKLSSGWEQPTGQGYPVMRREPRVKEMLRIKLSGKHRAGKMGVFVLWINWDCLYPSGG